MWYSQALSQREPERAERVPIWVVSGSRWLRAARARKYLILLTNFARRIDFVQLALRFIRRLLDGLLIEIIIRLFLG